MPLEKNIVGNVFGHLKILEVFFTQIGGRNRKIAKCVCKCGAECFRRVDSLSYKKIQSCGCLKTERIRSHCIKKSKPPHQRAVDILFKHYQIRAIQAQRAFTLSKEKFSALIFSKCAYCNIEPNNSLDLRRLLGDSVLYNGIDRFDNSRGYESDNCLSCCKSCNYLKHAIPLWLIDRMSQLRNQKQELA